VAIAMALAARPAVLVADEPTSALDVTVQAGVLDLLTALPATPDAPAPGLLLITHDLAVAAQTCSRVLVLDAGRLVADGTPRELFTTHAHPAVRALCEATEAMAL
jgi:peptide/nickel transport system ATP-binding protein